MRMIPYEHTGLSTISALNHQTRVACEFRNLLVIQTDRSDRSAWGSEKPATAAQDFLAYPLVVECLVKESLVILGTYFDSNLLAQRDIEAVSGQFGDISHRLSTKASSSLLREIIHPQDGGILLGVALALSSDPSGSSRPEVTRKRPVNTNPNTNAP